MTLMAVYRANGEAVGRCDARCFDAEHVECRCVCRGNNHGMGIDRATANTLRRAREWIAAYIRENRIAPATAEILGEPWTQSPLF